MAEPTTPKLTPARQEAALQALLKDGVRSWTPETIKDADIFRLLGAARLLDGDDPARSNRVLPPGMSLMQFDRMINREISRREAWPTYYKFGIMATEQFNGGARLSDLPELAGMMQVIRPVVSFEGYTGKSTTLHATPMTVAMYDNFIDMMIENKGGMALRADVARAEGLPKPKDGLAYQYIPQTDIGWKRMMYAFGAQEYFNPQPGSRGGSEVPVAGEFADTNGNKLTYGQIQDSYCGIVPQMYQKGMAPATTQPRDAGLPGFLESRMDRLTKKYDSKDMPPTGLFEPCSTPAAANNNQTAQQSAAVRR